MTSQAPGTHNSAPQLAGAEEAARAAVRGGEDTAIATFPPPLPRKTVSVDYTIVYIPSGWARAGDHVWIVWGRRRSLPGRATLSVGRGPIHGASDAGDRGGTCGRVRACVRSTVYGVCSGAACDRVQGRGEAREGGGKAWRIYTLTSWCGARRSCGRRLIVLGICTRSRGRVPDVQYSVFRWRVVRR